MKQNEFNKKLLSLLAEHFKGFDSKEYAILDDLLIKETGVGQYLDLQPDEVLIGSRVVQVPPMEWPGMYIDSHTQKFYIHLRSAPTNTQILTYGFYHVSVFKEFPEWLLKFFCNTGSGSEHIKELLAYVNLHMV